MAELGREVSREKLNRRLRNVVEWEPNKGLVEDLDMDLKLEDDDEGLAAGSGEDEVIDDGVDDDDDGGSDE